MLGPANLKLALNLGKFHCYEGNWSPTQFIVSNVNNTVPPTYVLKVEKGGVIDGCFYKEEGVKVKHPGVFWW